MPAETMPGAGRERGIIFAGANVRGILAGTKTQTRRVLSDDLQAAFDRAGEAILLRAPRQRGIGWDKVKTLWVREGFALLGDSVVYRAGHEEERVSGPRVDVRWRSPIHMPRWASRLTLTVTDVRVERLQAISEADAVSEGVREMRDGSGTFVGPEGPGKMVTPWPTAVEAYFDIWDSIHGKDARDLNPWIAALTFNIQVGNIDAAAPVEAAHAA